jgi:L-alanine-DL-glutamate epimerase-like enolase superfamily enzyme
MRITGIETVAYEYRLRRRIGDVNLPAGVAHNSELAVTISTDEGIDGVAIGLASAAGSIRLFVELLVGEDPLAVRSHWNRMVACAFKAGNAGGMKAAISAVDSALWDLRAKAHGVPLWKELGASQGRCAAYASGLDSPLTDDELATYYRSMAAQGINAGKLKVGRDAEADARRLSVMADALATSGKPPQLIIDANEFWSPKQAIQRIRALESDFELGWVEEPVSRTDHVGLRRVSDSIAAPVATGENLNQAHEFVPLLMHDAVDLVQIGVLTSGITGALQTAELAAAFQRPVTMSNCTGRMMAHLAAALPHHTTMEVLDAGRDAVLTWQPPIVDGQIVLGDRPGSGLEFDPDMLGKHRVEAPRASTLGTVYRRAPDAGLIG